MTTNPKAPSRIPHKRNCDVCGTYYEGRSPKTCSKTCRMKLAWSEGRQSRWGHGKGRVPFKGTCANCGKAFEREDYTPRKTCSVKCGAQLRAKEGRAVWGPNRRHPRWKGGVKTSNGYVMVYAPDHPNRRKRDGYVFEHRIVMEKALGRYLTKREIVHHRNGIKDDNRLENLQVVTHAKPYGVVTCPKCEHEFMVH